MSLSTVLVIALAALTVQKESADESRDIVVTAQPLEKTQAALDACVKRGCPPKEDIAATLAHAENLFVAGDYGEGRRTTSAGIRRNKRYAKELPVEISNLIRANSRIAAHEGEGEVYRLSLLDMRDTLRDGLGADDPRTLIARIEIADSLVSFEKVREAEREYDRIASAARKANVPVVEGYALLRKSMLMAALARRDAVMLNRARTVIKELADSVVPEHKPFAQAARIVRAQMEAKYDKTIAPEIPLPTVSASAGARPVLLYSEPIDFERGPNWSKLKEVSTTALTLPGHFSDQWADVGFFIKPDGSVDDIEPIRTGKGYDGDWLKPIMTSIATRRYAPVAVASGSPGLFRVERYTKTGRMTSVTRSRIRYREPYWRIEVLDMSEELPQVASNALRPEPAR